MTNHPYPQKIVDEIADYLKPYTASRIEAGSLAHQVLRRVWKASQVETIDDIHDVPESAVVRDKTGFVAVGREHAESNICYDDYPAHVIYWGDSDE